MVAAGILTEEERVELIGGELVPMTPKGNHHEVLKTALNVYWVQRLPKHLLVTTETTFQLAPDTYLEPDFVFYDKVTGLRGLTGKTAHLVVEIANSSFTYDIGQKAKLYAGFGIQELWVIHAVRQETHIHRKPSLDGYADITIFQKDNVLAPAFAPELAVTLGDLEL